MLPWLALFVLLLSAADHWTTYLCLQDVVSGFEVEEANPIADWLFRSVGLAEGLLVDSVVTVLGLGFLVRTDHVPHLAKLVFLGGVAAVTGFAVANNLVAVRELGLALTGG